LDRGQQDCNYIDAVFFRCFKTLGCLTGLASTHKQEAHLWQREHAMMYVSMFMLCFMRCGS